MNDQLTENEADGGTSAVDRQVGQFSDHGMQEIRIAWCIGNANGNGLWFPDTARHTLGSAVIDANRQYGCGTHWIEARRA